MQLGSSPCQWGHSNDKFVTKSCERTVSKKVYNEQVNDEPGNYGAGFLGLRQVLTRFSCCCELEQKTLDYSVFCQLETLCCFSSIPIFRPDVVHNQSWWRMLLEACPVRNVLEKTTTFLEKKAMHFGHVLLKVAHPWVHCPLMFGVCACVSKKRTEHISWQHRSCKIHDPCINKISKEQFSTQWGRCTRSLGPLGSECACHP